MQPCLYNKATELTMSYGSPPLRLLGPAAAVVVRGHDGPVVQVPHALLLPRPRPGLRTLAHDLVRPRVRHWPGLEVPTLVFHI